MDSNQAIKEANAMDHLVLYQKNKRIYRNLMKISVVVFGDDVLNDDYTYACRRI